MEKSKKMAVLMLVLTEVICLVFAVWKIFAGNGYMETFGAGKREIPTWENPISLPAGSYQMDVVYETASEEAWLRPMTDSSAGTVYGGKVLLFPYHTEASFEVRVGIDDGWFYLDGSTEDDLTISELTVQRTNRAETARCITLLVVFVILDVLLVLWYRGIFAGMDTAQRNVLFALVMLWLLSSLPLFVNYMVTGHDFAFHMMRIEGLAKGLKSGQFPVRVQPGCLNGYGYPVSVMYGDLLLYIPALLRLGGFTLQTAYKLYVLLINAVTVAASYACAKKIGRGWKVIRIYWTWLYRCLRRNTGGYADWAGRSYHVCRHRVSMAVSCIPKEIKRKGGRCGMGRAVQTVSSACACTFYVCDVLPMEIDR